jgi:hypothetical protein
MAAIAFASVLAACGDDSETLSCVVKLGAAQATASLDSKVGSSAVASIGGYSVTFTILDGSRLQGEVTDSKATSLMKSTAGGLNGGGSLGTADGRLDYSCVP